MQGCGEGSSRGLMVIKTETLRLGKLGKLRIREVLQIFLLQDCSDI
jgi:hypothetical protein